MCLHCLAKIITYDQPMNTAELYAFDGHTWEAKVRNFAEVSYMWLRLSGLES